MTQPAFVPKPGQVDFTNIRYAPVVNTVVTHAGKVLLVQRSADMRLYPNYWNGISGFLDDNRSIEQKVTEELQEELGITASAIKSLERGQVLLQEAPDYGKTWLVVPVLAHVTAAEFRLDWEVQRAAWFELSDVYKLDLLPGFRQVIDQFAEKL